MLVFFVAVNDEQGER
ncbi:Protein of unknown function [Bacillus cereus]|nr:Protein of unknown function [Bacillus cereus]